MRGENWLQKLLYLIMAILAGYIFYKGAGILLGSPAVSSSLDSGNVQRSLEDAAMRTYAPGYTAVVEGRESGGWMSGWMRQIAPVYSYLAEGQADTEEEWLAWAESESDTDQAQTADEIQQTEMTLPNETVTVEAISEVNKMEETEMPETEALQTNAETEAEIQEAAVRGVTDSLREQLRDFDYLLGNYFTVDGGTTADAELLDADALLDEDLRMERDPDVPQILIYHTHSQEAFADSREGEAADSIVGMGDALAEELREKYGYNVIHDTSVYDLVDGVLDRSAAYDYARASVEQILQDNPTIEVIIDLHRDGVEGQKFVTEIDGRPTSMIMFFNGISRNNLDEPLYWLQNPYINQNLAFSLQLQLKARDQYPGYTRNIYLKAERFNLHLRPRSLLIEAGTQLNTVEEERNAMIPLADLLDQVLSGT